MEEHPKPTKLPGPPEVGDTAIITSVEHPEAWNLDMDHYKGRHVKVLSVSYEDPWGYRIVFEEGCKWVFLEEAGHYTLAPTPEKDWGYKVDKAFAELFKIN